MRLDEVESCDEFVAEDVAISEVVGLALEEGVITLDGEVVVTHSALGAVASVKEAAISGDVVVRVDDDDSESCTGSLDASDEEDELRLCKDSEVKVTVNVVVGDEVPPCSATAVCEVLARKEVAVCVVCRVLVCQKVVVSKAVDVRATTELSDALGTSIVDDKWRIVRLGIPDTEPELCALTMLTEVDSSILDSKD